IGVFVVRRQSCALGRLVALENPFLQYAVKVKTRLVHDVGLHLASMRFSDKAGGHSLGADARGIDFDKRISLLELRNQHLRGLCFHGGVEDKLAFFCCAVDDRLGENRARDKDKPHQTGSDDLKDSAAHAHAPWLRPDRSLVNGQRISTDGRGGSTSSRVFSKDLSEYCIKVL